MVKLHFDGEPAAGRPRPVRRNQPAEGRLIDLKVDRTRVAEVLGVILDRYTVIDVSVQDPPLDQVIARVFEEARMHHEAEEEGMKDEG